MVFTSYKKQRILYYYERGFKPPTIKKKLEEEGLYASRVVIYKFLKKFLESGCITRSVGSGRPLKITMEVKRVVEVQMQKDNETTAHQLYGILAEEGYNISLKTVFRCRSSLGWTFRGSAYCQLIRDVNKAKRLEWAQYLYLNDGFEDVIFTDECSVQLETHKCFCCCKVGEALRPKPR